MASRDGWSPPAPVVGSRFVFTLPAISPKDCPCPCKDTIIIFVLGVRRPGPVLASKAAITEGILAAFAIRKRKACNAITMDQMGEAPHPTAESPNCYGSSTISSPIFLQPRSSEQDLTRWSDSP